MYSPTQEEIADAARAQRRKFSNRFVSMNTYHDAMMRIDALEAENRRLSELLAMYRVDNRDHLTRCINGRLYPGLGLMDDRCDLCKGVDSITSR